MSQEYEFLFVSKIKTTGLPNHTFDQRAVVFDHKTLTAKDVISAWKQILKSHHLYYINSQLIYYKLNHIKDSESGSISVNPHPCLIFIGIGQFKYKVVYYQDDFGHITHHYAQFTLNHKITDETVDQDYRDFITQIFNSGSARSSNCHILLHAPVDD